MITKQKTDEDGEQSGQTATEGIGDDVEGKRQTPERRTFRQFWRKYFLQGQQLDPSHTSPSNGTPASELSFHERHRKYIGFLLPFGFMHLCWWTLAIRYDVFGLYPTRWPMAVTMIFGAIIGGGPQWGKVDHLALALFGGATSEGGGAVAFPVMTLLLHIDSVVARDFSLMIQSTGMTSAAFTILYMRVMVEWHSAVFCTLGSTCGILVGLQFVDDVFSGPTKKMMFVSIWVSFSIALFLLNRQHKRIAHLTIQKFNAWKAVVLILTGFLGGMFSAFSGSGVDICAFSVLTLLFRVSEKIATPTSVLLMAANTLVGFFWRQLIQQGISDDAWEYFEVSVPVVVICAPLGAFLSSHLHRQVLAAMIYALEALALAGFLVTLPPLRFIAIGAGIIVFSFLFFSAISRLGQHLDERGGKLQRGVCDGASQTTDSIDSDNGRAGETKERY